MGTMKQAEKKENFWARLGVSLLTFLAFLLCYVIKCDVNDFADRAGLVANLFGVVFFIVTVCAIWLSEKLFPNVNIGAGYYSAVWLVGTALGITTSCGFNFDYFGL